MKWGGGGGKIRGHFFCQTRNCVNSQLDVSAVERPQPRPLDQSAASDSPINGLLDLRTCHLTRRGPRYPSVLRVLFKRDVTSAWIVVVFGGRGVRLGAEPLDASESLDFDSPQVYSGINTKGAWLWNTRLETESGCGRA